MTTATFDKENDQFIINTPSLEAIKFWTGELGIYASHAIIFAQLIVDGLKLGIQPFFVPIRDPVTRQTYPGVEAGDIGPK